MEGRKERVLWGERGTKKGQEGEEKRNVKMRKQEKGRKERPKTEGEIGSSLRRADELISSYQYASSRSDLQNGCGGSGQWAYGLGGGVEVGDSEVRPRANKGKLQFAVLRVYDYYDCSISEVLKKTSEAIRSSVFALKTISSPGRDAIEQHYRHYRRLSLEIGFTSIP
ncbi:hypothetical protein NQZ68_035257 [Dissostichus eleginoides]|nr:hypothetical protein NQZ68_035257 [Dissostichus eleginoides]